MLCVWLTAERFVADARVPFVRDTPRFVGVCSACPRSDIRARQETSSKELVQSFAICNEIPFFH